MAEKKAEKNGAPMGPGTSSIKDPEVYEALRTLQERGVLRIEYGGLRIVQAQALRRADF